PLRTPPSFPTRRSSDLTGMLPFVFDEGFGYERYCDYALDVPMYFVYRDGKYIDVAGESFRAFIEGKLPQLPGEKPTLTDWIDHLDRKSTRLNSSHGSIS